MSFVSVLRFAVTADSFLFSFGCVVFFYCHVFLQLSVFSSFLMFLQSHILNFYLTCLVCYQKVYMVPLLCWNYHRLDEQKINLCLLPGKLHKQD